jgi:hypothetical protein
MRSRLCPSGGRYLRSCIWAPCPCDDRFGRKCNTMSTLELLFDLGIPGSSARFQPAVIMTPAGNRAVSSVFTGLPTWPSISTGYRSKGIVARRTG